VSLELPKQPGPRPSQMFQKQRVDHFDRSPGATNSFAANPAAEPIAGDSRRDAGGKRVVFVLAGILCAIWTATSYARWASFGYRTFDLAYYVQAIWQFIHGRFSVSLENVPLLGNHVEPIVFLFAPFFALVRHPILFVAVQNAALAIMAPIGYNLALRTGFDSRSALYLAAALLLAPATGYVALHEFHPEALAAPLLLLMLYARSTRRLWLHWLSFIAVLSCKENMALLLSAYCVVFLFTERETGFAQLARWYGGPLVLAVLWFVICAKVITPAFNAGNIDYLSLYDRLGNSGGEILWNMIARPRLFVRALTQAVTHGNLVWALLLPFLALPLLRPRWILIGAPVLFQHLFSWRSSEWTIFFHYAAPLLPLFWLGAVEAIARIRDRVKMPVVTLGMSGAMTIACLVSQISLGPGGAIASEFANWRAQATERVRKEAVVRQITAGASVVAPLPYLSHLAMRERLYSLHYILKGLKTLSHDRYEPPPPPDVVLVDYNDSATFDAGSGYYHPQVRTTNGRIIPSSDRLLWDFLSQTSWDAESDNELTIYRKRPPNGSGHAAVPPDQKETGRTPVYLEEAGLELLDIHQADRQSNSAVSESRPLEIELQWAIRGDRKAFPWMLLGVSAPGKGPVATFAKGLCAIEAREGSVTERWRTTLPGLPPGNYTAVALFVDQPKRAWSETHGSGQIEETLLGPPIPVGHVRIGSGPIR
jgi:uncharacterized membrane protein